MVALPDGWLDRFVTVIKQAGGFESLRVVQVGGEHGFEGLDRACAALGCRVQGIDGGVTGREEFAVAGVLWEGIGERGKWYDAVPGGEEGEGVKWLMG